MYEQSNITRNLVDYGMKQFLLNLQSLVRIPSVSAKNEGLLEAANLVTKIMRKAGISTELLNLDGREEFIAPIVYGEVKSKSNPNGKTLLFYNHYDVQPVEPVSRWERHPFSGQIVGDKIFGRGSSDDKGELMVRIKAVESIINWSGDVPCNLKFVVEGGEEIGSPHLKKYLQRFAHKLKCDGIVWEFGYVDVKTRPIINLGMKGMLYVELLAVGPCTDIHSSLAVLVPNPAWKIVNALNSLWDEKTGIIKITDWYRECRSLSSRELSFSAAQPAFDDFEFKAKYRLDHLVSGLSRNQIRRALAERPTCNISGISSGYVGAGAKTVLPMIARAMIDFRLVLDMIPEIQFNRLRAHLLRNEFSNIYVKFVHGLKPYRTYFADPFVRTVVGAAFAAFNQKPIINLSSAGSGPMSLLVESTKAPCVAVGCSDMYSNIHSYNEFARIPLLKLGTKLMIELINRFASAY